MKLFKLMVLCVLCASCAFAAPEVSQTISLDGNDWLICADAENAGKNSGWAAAPQKGCKKGRVPGIMQEVLGDYHGVAWYYKTFTVPAGDFQRAYLRFYETDFAVDIYVNGEFVMNHKGNEEIFLADITKFAKTGENLLSVRVVKPAYQQIIDDMELGEIPHRNQVDHVHGGSDYNYGGLTDSVELLLTPAVTVRNVYVKPDWKTGDVKVLTTIYNDTGKKAKTALSYTVAPAKSGEDILSENADYTLTPGENVVETTVTVPGFKLWSLEEPNLYRITVASAVKGEKMVDTYSDRFGFRDFRFEDGYFKLNGKRIFLKCNHSGGEAPVGIRVGLTEEVFRNDILHFKSMGFNMQRYIAGIGRRYQADLADEIGHLIFDESFAAWGMGWNLSDPAKMGSRKMLDFWTNETKGMIMRDRNHPSVVIWCLLNETPFNEICIHAHNSLGDVMSWDDTRVVLLNSGNFHVAVGATDKPGNGYDTYPDAMKVRRTAKFNEPNVTYNDSDSGMKFCDSHWEPRELTAHVGTAGEKSVIRFTAPESGSYDAKVAFAARAAKPSTPKVTVVVSGKEVFSDEINVNGKPDNCAWSGKLNLKKGDTVDAVVGATSGVFSETTAVDFTIGDHNAAKEFTDSDNPNGVWSYGYMDDKGFVLYDSTLAVEKNSTYHSGVFANPGDTAWQSGLDDIHPYQSAPHTAPIINTLRTIAPHGWPVFISEYGVGSGMNLDRLIRKYQEIGWGGSVDANYYKDRYNEFMRYWNLFGMERIFASPTRFGEESLSLMARQREFGIDALRANPKVVAHSLTGGPDHGFSGEGVVTKFREYKPGTVDALSGVFSKLRICAFAEPMNAYNNAAIDIDAMLVNEDVLAPGTYPVRVTVMGENGVRVYDKTHEVTVSEGDPFAVPIFKDKVQLKGCPAGKYHLYCDMVEGGAPSGGKVELFVYDTLKSDALKGVSLAVRNDDERLKSFLTDLGAKIDPNANLVLDTAPTDEDVKLAESGKTVVVLKAGDGTVINLPKPATMGTASMWLYLRDDFAMPGSPVFEGFPTGMMDHFTYRQVISSFMWRCDAAPDDLISAAVNTAAWIDGGVTLAGYKVGKGMVYLNSLNLRECVGNGATGEKLLVNLIKYLSE